MTSEAIDLLPEAPDVVEGAAPTPKPTPKPTPTYPEGDATKIATDAQEVIAAPMPAARGTDIPHPDAYKPRAPLTERDKAFASTRKPASAIDSGAVSMQDRLRRGVLKELNGGKQDGATQ